MLIKKYAGRFLKTFIMIILLGSVLTSVSGCATIGQGLGGIFSLFGKAIGGTFHLVGKILDIVAKMPKPPPGVF